MRNNYQELVLNRAGQERAIMNGGAAHCRRALFLLGHITVDGAAEEVVFVGPTMFSFVTIFDGSIAPGVAFIVNGSIWRARYLKSIKL
jgi:hypothetical protein